MTVSPAPGYPRLRVTSSLAVQDQVSTNQRHRHCRGLLDEERRLVDPESHHRRLSHSRDILRLTLILPVVGLGDGPDDEAAALQAVVGVLSEREQVTVLQPGDGGGWVALRGLAGDHHIRTHRHVHIRGQALELFVDI